jgi:uncharacterized coiled-coil DUF342 family protein
MPISGICPQHAEQPQEAPSGQPSSLDTAEEAQAQRDRETLDTILATFDTLESGDLEALSELEGVFDPSSLMAEFLELEEEQGEGDDTEALLDEMAELRAEMSNEDLSDEERDRLLERIQAITDELNAT